MNFTVEITMYSVYHYKSYQLQNKGGVHSAYKNSSTLNLDTKKTILVDTRLVPDLVFHHK